MYTCLCLKTRVGPGPPQDGVSISSLSEGSGYYTAGPGLPRGSGLHGRSGAPAVRAERLPLPGHVVSPDLSQPWDGSGPLLGEQDSGPQGFGCLDVVKDNTRLLPRHSKRGYPSPGVPTVAPGPTSGEVQTRGWGHYRDVFLRNLIASVCSCREQESRTPESGTQVARFRY